MPGFLSAGRQGRRLASSGRSVAFGRPAVLGRLDYFADLPAGAVMVVKGEREHWVPAAPKHLLKVDLAAKRLTVDWPAELE